MKWFCTFHIPHLVRFNHVGEGGGGIKDVIDSKERKTCNQTILNIEKLKEKG